MARWDIQPSGVQGVLHRVEGVAEQFEGQVRSINEAMRGAGAEASSGIVGQALAGFAEAWGPDMQFVFSRIQSALGGASTAVGAYLQGDHDMVLNAQRGVSNAPDPREHMPGGGRR